MISLGREFDMEYKARLMVDASAALGVAQRMGVGKIRHLQTGALWLQEQELRKVLRLAKVPGRLTLQISLSTLCLSCSPSLVPLLCAPLCVSYTGCASMHYPLLNFKALHP